jgi:glycosyltransferase involved in cell wall biosynthesis
MARIAIIAGIGVSLIRFRGDLIDSWIAGGHTVIAAAPGRDVEEKLKIKGVEYFSIPLERAGLNPVKDFVLLLHLIRLFYRVKPDFLFLYTVKPVIYGSLAAYLKPGCRVFSMITGLGYVFSDAENKGLLQKLTACLYRIALKRNEKVFFQNPDDLALFQELRLVAERKCLLVNGSGVNLDYYKPATLPTGAPVFLMIARLLKEKGFKEYVKAARTIKEKYPEVIFKMIAWQLKGSPSVIPADQVERWKAEGLVEIFGETDDVRSYLVESSVYVLPSYREGTPRTVLEAMAMGRAIITTDAPGCRETVIDWVNGFLVPVRDSKSLAAAMERFILEPELIAKMGKASRRIAEEKYDVHKVNQVINRAMRLL